MFQAFSEMVFCAFHPQLVCCHHFFICTSYWDQFDYDRELYSNNISGQIPSDLGNLTSLVSLDLYLNRFTGAIPDTLGKLTKLRFLYEYTSFTLFALVSFCLSGCSALCYFLWLFILFPHPHEKEKEKKKNSSCLLEDYSAYQDAGNIMCVWSVMFECIAFWIENKWGY